MTHRRLLPILSCLVLALNGCGEFTMESMLRKHADADVFAQRYLDTIRSGDVGFARSQMAQQNNTPSVAQEFAKMQEAFGDSEVVAVEHVGFRLNMTPSVSQYSLTYQYQMSDRWVTANVVLRKANAGFVVYGVNVSTIPDSLQNLHRFRLSGKKPLAYVTLVLMGLVPILMIASAVCAIRWRVRRRWLWVFLSFVGISKFHLVWTTGVVNVQLATIVFLGLGAMRVSEHAPWVFTAPLPVFALILLSYGRAWKKKDRANKNLNADTGNGYAESNSFEESEVSGDAPGNEDKPVPVR
jgi:hypothetical protein